MSEPSQIDYLQSRIAELEKELSFARKMALSQQARYSECCASEKALITERDELASILSDLNSRVFPGETDSLDSLREMYRERNLLKTQLAQAEAFNLERKKELVAERERVRKLEWLIQDHAEGGNIENYQHLSDKIEALLADQGGEEL